MMTETVNQFEIEEKLVANFNGPEDDEDDFEDDDFNLEIDAVGDFDDFDDDEF